jgi:hypothetical protein
LTGYQFSLEDEYHHSTGFCKFETETGVLWLQAKSSILGYQLWPGSMSQGKNIKGIVYIYLE